MAFVSVSDFLKTFRIVSPTTPEWVISSFVAQLRGKEYFSSEKEIKDRLDLFLAGQSIEDGTDINIITELYNGIDLTIQDLRMLKSLPNTIESTVKEIVSSEIGANIEDTVKGIVTEEIGTKIETEVQPIVKREIDAQLVIFDNALGDTIGNFKQDVSASTTSQINSAKTAIGTETDSKISNAKTTLTTETEAKITAAKTALATDTDTKITNAKSAIATDTQGKISDATSAINTETDAKISNAKTALTADTDTKITAAKTALTTDTDTKISGVKTTLTTETDTKIASAKSEADTKITAAKTALTTDLDTKITTVDQRYEQPDYVGILERYANYTTMLFRKVSETKQEIILHNGARHLTYEILKSVDDMLIQTKVTTGTVTSIDKGLLKSYGTSLGVYTTGWAVKPSDGVAGYTTTVGTTFTLPIEVEQDDSEIKLTLYRRANGGLWSFQIDGQAAVELSTYNADATVTDEKLLYSSVPKGSYTLTGTYKGADPASAEAAPRGWVPKPSEPFVKINGRVLSFAMDTVLTEPSNKEFAISFKPATGATDYKFFPYHGDATSFKAEEPIFLDGMKEIKLSTTAIGELVPIKDFTLVQHLYARHPDTGTENIMEAWCNTRITPGTGKLSIDGKIKVLKPTNLTNSYVIMSTARGDLFDRVVTSFRNQYIGTTDTYGTNIPMAPERDWAKSLVFLSGTNKDVAIATRYNNVKDTLRQGATNKDTNPGNMTYLQNRDATLKKVYTRLYNNATVPAGHTIRFSGDYMFVVMKNVYNILGVD